CHPVHERTSYSSNPQSPLANSNRSSTAQRAPATRTNSASVVAGGPPHAKYATSVGSDVLRRINSQRAYSAGSGGVGRVTAQSDPRGPSDPSPQLSLCQASAGTPASNVPTRTCRNPAHTAKSARTPTTYPSPWPSTVVRKW